MRDVIKEMGLQDWVASGTVGSEINGLGGAFKANGSEYGKGMVVVMEGLMEPNDGWREWGMRRVKKEVG